MKASQFVSRDDAGEMRDPLQLGTGDWDLEDGWVEDRPLALSAREDSFLIECFHDKWNVSSSTFFLAPNYFRTIPRKNLTRSRTLPLRSSEPTSESMMIPSLWILFTGAAAQLSCCWGPVSRAASVQSQCSQSVPSVTTANSLTTACCS